MGEGGVVVEFSISGCIMTAVGVRNKKGYSAMHSLGSNTFVAVERGSGVPCVLPPQYTFEV